MRDKFKEIKMSEGIKNFMKGISYVGAGAPLLLFASFFGNKLEAKADVDFKSNGAIVSRDTGRERSYEGDSGLEFKVSASEFRPEIFNKAISASFERVGVGNLKPVPVEIKTLKPATVRLNEVGDIEGVNKGNKYNISQKGIDMVKNFEGFSDKPYKDSGGKFTIGYGHLIRKGESFDKITKDEAENILRNDIKIAEKAVLDKVKVDLSQNQYEALVSLTYNIGVDAFRGSSLLRELNKGNYDVAASKFKDWKYCNKKIVKGLINRRKSEREQFMRK